MGIAITDLEKTGHDALPIKLRDFIATSLNKPVGHDLTRDLPVSPNRRRTGYDRFKYSMNQMGLSPSVSCESGPVLQVSMHAISLASVRYTNAAGTWSCLTLQHAIGFVTGKM